MTTSLEIASPALRTVVHRVLAGLDSSLLRSVSVGSPPASLSARRARSLPANARWLSVEFVVQSGAAGAVKGDWEALMLAGAVRDLAALRGLAPISGVTIQPVLPSGAPARCCERRAHVIARSPPLALPDVEPGTFEARIRVQAERAGLTVRSIAFLQPLGLAAEIRLTIDPLSPSTVSRAEQQLPADGSEGVLYKWYDKTGALLCVHGAATRTGISSGWSAEPCRFTVPGSGGIHLRAAFRDLHHRSKPEPVHGLSSPSTARRMSSADTGTVG